MPTNTHKCQVQRSEEVAPKIELNVAAALYDLSILQRQKQHRLCC